MEPVLPREGTGFYSLRDGDNIATGPGWGLSVRLAIHLSPWGKSSAVNAMKHRPPPEFSLGSLYREVAASWDPEKNSPLTPFDVRPKSNKMVWWRCGNGHSWQAVVATRTNGSGCPYCAGRKPTRKHNLLVAFPDIAKEWHPIRNGSLTPSDITPKSNRQVWWRCSEGHEWRSKLSNRTALGQGCPFCAGNRPTKQNNFATLYPDLLSQWHWDKNAGIDPARIAPKSHKKVWWFCQYGHEWTATVAHRTGGTGCPYCAPHTSRLELRLYAELKTLLDDIKWRNKLDDLEVDLYWPVEKIAIEIDGYPWHRDTEARDRRKSRALARKGIRFFRLRDSRLPLLEESDLQFDGNEPHLLVINRLLTALLPSLGDDTTQRVQKYVMSGKYRNEQFYQTLLSCLPGPVPEYSLTHQRPDLAKEWHPRKNGALLPHMFSVASGYVAWWKCERQHAWRAAINNRTTRSTGCPFCSGRYATSQNNLAVYNPSLAKEWHQDNNGALTPSDVTPKSNRKVWWRCARGHIYEASVKNRSNGRGCPYCANKRPSHEYNLSVLFPRLAMEWEQEKNGDKKPEDFLPQSNKKVWWHCEVGHTWQARIQDRVKGTGCPSCNQTSRRTQHR